MDKFFGYRKVGAEQKRRLVGEVFESVAGRYDLMNDLMSLGLHRLWKRIAVEFCAPRPGQRVLDLAGGTGDMAALLAPHIGDSGQIVLADISAAMLHRGRERMLNRGLARPLHWAQADAEQLPFEDETFDLISIAFGLRNVTDKPKALGEMHRVLKTGGRLLVLEFSRPTHDWLNRLYNLYSFSVLPALGRFVARDEASYRYLAESIRMHPAQEALQSMIAEAGFSDCDHQNISGGIVAIHRGRKA